jgi:hypothetical protein
VSPRGIRRSEPAWSTDAGRPVEHGFVEEPERPSAPAEVRTRVRKFTAQLDVDSADRFARLLAEVQAEVGPIATRVDGDRVRRGYDVSRADVLRSLLAVAEADPAVMAAVCAKVREQH